LRPSPAGETKFKKLILWADICIGFKHLVDIKLKEILAHIIVHSGLKKRSMPLRYVGFQTSLHKHVIYLEGTDFIYA